MPGFIQHFSNESPRSFQSRVLHDRLKKEIVRGIHKIGDTLPSENELSSASYLARSTARQALSQLEKEGYIVIHQESLP